MPDKALAQQLLDDLPESAALAEITAEVRILAALRTAQDSLAYGRAIPHEAVRQLFQTWTGN